jgi:hypothetical protein
MSLYCLKRDILHKGERTIIDVFFGDEETARGFFNDSKVLRIASSVRELTLFEINTKGRGITDLKTIPFELFNPIDHFDSSEGDPYERQ